MSQLPLTSSSTVGPFFSGALLREDARRQVLIQPGTPGERVRIEGRVLDGDRQPVTDGLIEIWQANSHGRYNHPSDTRPVPLEPSFSGFGRSGTEDEGRYWFETIKPGSVLFKDSTPQAPHLLVTLFSRGLLNHLFTRVYFEDDQATAGDPVLARVPPDLRTRLVARRRSVGQAVVYTWDIILQGEGETPFFNL